MPEQRKRSYYILYVDGPQVRYRSAPGTTEYTTDPGKAWRWTRYAAAFAERCRGEIVKEILE